MITVENVVKRYGDIVALNGISLNVRDGEIYGLLGPNGSGKSTLLKMMAGISTPTSGRIAVNGVDVSEDPLKVREITGYVPETPTLFESLTPVEFLNFVASVRRIPPEEYRRRAKHLVEAFDLQKYLHKMIGSLSFGTKQKVSLIAAMIHDPEVLILDESMNGLDPKSARILRELLAEFKREGRSIIFSTHVLQLAELVCDRVGVIYRGSVMAEGTVDELKKLAHEENLEDVFLSLTESKEEVSLIVKVLSETL